MQRVIMKSEIHRATMGGAALDFDGSCGVAPALMRAANIDSTRSIMCADAGSRVAEQAAIA
jgi:aspartate 1-decarboxylase